MIKVERNPVPPPSLAIEATKKNGSYREADVIRQLADNFHEKCYICEIKPVQDPQVEHRLPHCNRGIPERVFDWNNLFYSCSHCNNVKNNKKYEEGIIDCCARDPEELLAYQLEGNRVHVFLKTTDDSEADRTAELIEEVFNSTSTGIRSEAAEVRLRELQKIMNAFYTALEQYIQTPENKIARKTLIALLDKETAFSGFTRSYARAYGLTTFIK